MLPQLACEKVSIGCMLNSKQTVSVQFTNILEHI